MVPIFGGHPVEVDRSHGLHWLSGIVRLLRLNKSTSVLARSAVQISGIAMTSVRVKSLQKKKRCSFC